MKQKIIDFLISKSHTITEGDADENGWITPYCEKKKWHPCYWALVVWVYYNRIRLKISRA